ncbi:MAG: phosphopantetheinyl transferase (holo-ACP synthase) [Myxococcota bacterium]|jgi:phosphopantetheinyl transferase (holo-ACP synthase)
MVGNDVVDLHDSDASAAHYRGGFDARVFTDGERQRIERAPVRAAERWRLWAAKEASYKLARQRDSKTIFSPKAFEVQTAPDTEVDVERVVHAASTYLVTLDATASRIHAIAVRGDNANANIVSGVAAMADGACSRNEGDAVRRLACDEIAKQFDLPREGLEIRKDGKLPRLYQANKRLPLSLSLSHHGSWLAFACTDSKATLVGGA